MQAASPKGAAAPAGVEWKLLPQPALLAGAGKTAAARGSREGGSMQRHTQKAGLACGAFLISKHAINYIIIT